MRHKILKTGPTKIVLRITTDKKATVKVINEITKKENQVSSTQRTTETLFQLHFYLIDRLKVLFVN